MKQYNLAARTNLLSQRGNLGHDVAEDDGNGAGGATEAQGVSHSAELLVGTRHRPSDRHELSNGARKRGSVVGLGGGGKVEGGGDGTEDKSSSKGKNERAHREKIVGWSRKQGAAGGRKKKVHGTSEQFIGSCYILQTKIRLQL